MKELLKTILLVLIAVLALILTACGGSSSDSGGGGTPVGTFTKQFGATASGSSAFPFEDSLDVKMQYLYTAAEIGGSGIITKIRMRQAYSTTADVTCPNMTIKMGHTDNAVQTTLWANNTNTGQGSEQIVINNKTITIPKAAANSWVEIILDTPFEYNGVDNLVVDFERTTKCSDTVNMTFFNVTDRRAWDSVPDNIAGTAEYSATNAGVDDYLPWMQFVFVGGDNTQNYGGTNGNAVPFNPTSYRTQNLYLASDIKGSGPITGIAFQLNNNSVSGTYAYSLKLAHTTLNTLTGNTSFADNYSGTPTTVAGSVTFTIPEGIPAGEWFWVPVPDGVFTYNGTDNLIVEVAVTSGTAFEWLRTTAMAGSRLIVDSLSAPVGTVDAAKYNIKLRFNGGPVDIIGSNDMGLLVFNNTATGSQFLLNASDLGTSGSISKIALRLFFLSNYASYPDFTVTLAQTTQQVLAAADATNVLGGMTGYNGSFDIDSGLSEGDWVEIPLGTPFNYNGKDNLVVQITSGAGTAQNTCQISSNATRFKDHLKATGGNNPTSYCGVFKFWVRK
jgi:hypothetical protein